MYVHVKNENHQPLQMRFCEVMRSASVNAFQMSEYVFVISLWGRKDSDSQDKT